MQDSAVYEQWLDKVEMLDDFQNTLANEKISHFKKTELDKLYTRGRFAIVSFNDYLACYNSMTQSVLSSIHNTLASLNIIMFILYMIFLVQEKINESKKFLQMNQELQDLNEQLKEYANIREKMGATRERNRLAREIHDTLGHTLTGLRSKYCSSPVSLYHINLSC